MTPEPVQRWRIVYSRGPAARDMTQRAEQEAWETAVTASGLPAVGADAGRPRLGFGIPLPVGLTADAERFDVTLTARLAARRVGPALGRVAPAGHQVVDLHDVWIGEPSLVSRVVAADYRLVVAAAGGEPGVVGEQVLAAACRSLMATRRLERVRRKGDREVSYDLRPFLLAIDAADDARGGVLRMRLGADPATGVGRPDEVVAAVGEALGLSLVMLEGGRERIWLVDELDL